MNFFMTYILPVLIMAVLAGLLGLCLAYLSFRLRTDHDERIDKVRENLPGINCGGCGYAGCDAFAEALVKGQTDIERCRPSSGEGRSKIGDILGIQVEERQPKVAAVRCNGGNAAVDKASYQGYGSCASASMLGGGTKTCAVGCMGFGDCVKSCQYDAIHIDKDTDVAVVDPNRCIMCGACLTACPKDLIHEVKAKSKVFVACSSTCGPKKAAKDCARSCIACGLCQKACKFRAIKIVDNLARIDHDKCTACGECVKKCPHGCILIRQAKRQKQ